MTAQVIDLDARRDERDAHLPVWRVVKGRCGTCGREAVSVQHIECSLDDTECSCGHWEFCVTHFEVEGHLVPRLELVGGG